MRSFISLVRFSLWTFSLIPAQMVLLALNSPAARRLPKFYHRGVCRIIGFHVVVKGEPSLAAPVLFVSNHSSYLDITVLGSVLEDRST